MADVIHFNETGVKELTQKMAIEHSLVAPHLTKEFKWDGAKTIRLTTAVTQPMNDYKRTGNNRYGEPVEVPDWMQKLTLSQDKAFSLTIDKGNSHDQNRIKERGNALLEAQLAEQAMPLFDRYCIDKMMRKAGKIVGNNTALGKSNIVDRITDGTTWLDDAEIAQNGRTLFISAKGYKQLKLSDEFIQVEKIANRALTKGVVGTFDNMTVVKVPKGRWPEGLNFLIVQKNCAAGPMVIDDTNIHLNPPGISGHLMEGRQYYDCFVIAARADGVYADVDTNVLTISAKPSISAAGAVTGTGTLYYTLDGSDPRYSADVQNGSPDGVASGTVVRAYAVESGKLPSEVVEVKVK